ncbi:sugar-transfer associated ATP-grasp domain-containing protein [Flavobacterium sp. KS-LB2]|uniref:sugar-transfer associated ATP-grasp domain-containing protein n=1 Tax=Flavobacterium sp. KS-LB2 TaxID=3120525 RepID=UPI0030D26FFB
MIQHTLYLGYYLKQMKWKLLKKFLTFAAKETGKSKTYLLLSSITSVYVYNISILEYFQFRFYSKNTYEKKQWAGTGYMYEYQLLMNPKEARHILDDKRQFYKAYQKYFVHTVAALEDLKNDLNLAKQLLLNPSGKMVFKAADGKCGVSVEVVNTIDFDTTSMIAYMETKGLDLVEEFITQHAAMNALSPSGVNTVRIFTQLDKNNEVIILGCRQRISVDSQVDNMAAGNIAAMVDEETGKISGPGIYSDITKKEEIIHPITGVLIIGFQVPFWNECIAMVKAAAKLHPQNRSIGWDIVVTDNGPGFIEGNHDWCKLLWQLPVNQGLKHTLEVHKK